MEYTPIHNRFWSDGWVRELNALDRYLFLYLLTNGRAKLTGIYELPLDLMASESGIDQKDLRLSMLQRLEPKIYYKEGWVIITNYLKHRIGGGHKYNAGVKANYNELPSKIQALAESVGYPIHTLSIEYQRFPSIVDKNRVDINTHELSPGKKKEKSVWREDVPKKSKRERIVPTTPSSVVDKWNAYPTWKALKRPGSPPNPSAVDKLLPTAKTTPDIQAAIIRKRTKYTEAEFNLAIENYVLDILNRKQDKSTYYTHRFTLYEFLVNKDVFEKYVNR